MTKLLANVGYGASIFLVGAALLGGIDLITGLMSAGGMATASHLMEGDSDG